jgi:hypothetical protein
MLRGVLAQMDFTQSADQARKVVPPLLDMEIVRLGIMNLGGSLAGLHSQLTTKMEYSV